MTGENDIAKLSSFRKSNAAKCLYFDIVTIARRSGLCMC